MIEFKDTEGRWKVGSMFWEHKNDSYTPLFTLKGYDLEKDGVVYPSLKLLYMDYTDPTEYQFATEVLGGWDHWTKVSSSYIITEQVAEWRAEMEVKLRSTAIRAIYDSARSDGSKGIAAAKYIADRGWEKARGRPSKAEIEKERKIQAGINDDLASDSDRIGLH